MYSNCKCSCLIRHEATIVALAGLASCNLASVMAKVPALPADCQGRNARVLLAAPMILMRAPLGDLLRQTDCAAKNQLPELSA